MYFNRHILSFVRVLFRNTGPNMCNMFSNLFLNIFRMFRMLLLINLHMFRFIILNKINLFGHIFLNRMTDCSKKLDFIFLTHTFIPTLLILHQHIYHRQNHLPPPPPLFGPLPIPNHQTQHRKKMLEKKKPKCYC